MTEQDPVFSYHLHVIFPKDAKVNYEGKKRKLRSFYMIDLKFSSPLVKGDQVYVNDNYVGIVTGTEKHSLPREDGPGINVALVSHRHRANPTELEEILTDQRTEQTEFADK